jgi:hypothetical protein
LLTILGAVIVAGAVVWTGLRISGAPKRTNGAGDATAALLALFAPAMATSADDPRAVLAWQPIAAAARVLFPKEFADLDRAFGTTFPFSADQIERAHARWTTDWLAWERRHDGEFKLKAAQAAHDLGSDASSPLGRARLDAVEREKLDLYQQHYEEYTRIARGLQALIHR